MATLKQRRAAKRRLKQYLLAERRYYRQIRALYTGWLNDWLPRIGQSIGLKLDAASDWLGPLFAEMASDFAKRVERFKISIKAKGKDIAALTQLAPSDDVFVNMAVQPWNTEPAILDEIEDFAAENAALITNIGNVTTQRIQAATVNAIKTGQSSTALKKAILKIDNDLGKNRARLIARDQIGKLQGQISRTRSEAAGITEYEWMTAGDERVRSSHKALDGTVRKWSESPIPGSEISCRCTNIPVIN